MFYGFYSKEKCDYESNKKRVNLVFFTFSVKTRENGDKSGNSFDWSK